MKLEKLTPENNWEVYEDSDKVKAHVRSSAPNEP